MRHIIYLLLSSDVLWSVDDSFFPCCPLFLAEWQQKQQQRLPHARAIVGRWGGSSYRQRQHACWVLKEMNCLTAALMSPSFPLFPLFLFFFFIRGCQTEPLMERTALCRDEGASAEHVCRCLLDSFSPGVWASLHSSLGLGECPESSSLLVPCHLWLSLEWSTRVFTCHVI